MFPETQGRLHSPGRDLLREDVPKTWLGKPDGTEAISFCVSRLMSRRSIGSLLVGFNSSGSKCTTPAGTIQLFYTYSHVLGHVQSYSSITLIS
jgi:hypothetical protein